MKNTSGKIPRLLKFLRIPYSIYVMVGIIVCIFAAIAGIGIVNVKVNGNVNAHTGYSIDDTASVATAVDEATDTKAERLDVSNESTVVQDTNSDANIPFSVAYAVPPNTTVKSRQKPQKALPEKDSSMPAYTLFVVLDDAGAAVEQVHMFLPFPETLTFAILPYLEYSTKIATILASHNIPYILHMPMQPLGRENPGEHAILVSYTNNKLKNIIYDNLAAVDGIIGVNNHMGSLATSDKTVMTVFLRILGEKKLFFLDSRTSASSVSKEVATSLGMTVLERDVFIDNESDVEKIIHAIRNGIQIAKSAGYAILIGHATKPETAQALLDIYSEVKSDNGTFAGLDTYNAVIDTLRNR